MGSIASVLQWHCPACAYINPTEVTRCVNCSTSWPLSSRPSSAPVGSKNKTKKSLSSSLSSSLEQHFQQQGLSFECRLEEPKTAEW